MRRIVVDDVNNIISSSPNAVRLPLTFSRLAEAVVVVVFKIDFVEIMKIVDCHV